MTGHKENLKSTSVLTMDELRKVMDTLGPPPPIMQAAWLEVAPSLVDELRRELEPAGDANLMFYGGLRVEMSAQIPRWLILARDSRGKAIGYLITGQDWVWNEAAAERLIEGLTQWYRP